MRHAINNKTKDDKTKTKFKFTINPGKTFSATIEE
jgi:hypothetical protein